MDVQSLKRWHWIVIGLVAGSLFAAAKLMSASDERLGGPGFLSQAEFERSLRVPPAGSRPFVSGIVIHTGPRADLVRFRQLTAALEYAELRFAAPRPYRPLGESAPASENYTVGNYLTDMAATNPSLSFRTAWWDSAGPQLAIGATVGALLIGGAWPVLLRLMVGAGLGRKGEPRYDLDRFHHGPDEKKDVTLTEVNCAHLAELEAEMLASLGSAGEAPIAPEEPGCRAAAAPPRRDLCAAQIEPAASAPAVPDKAYDGQF